MGKSGVAKTAALRIGTPSVVEAPSTDSRFVVVFEDDGETGYLYGLDTSRDQPIVDALLLYQVAEAGPGADSMLEIVWSSSGSQALLRIDGHARAVFDFRAKRAYCRTGSPPPSHTGWTSQPHDWDEGALSFFR